MTKRRKYIISSAIAVLCMLGIIAILVLIMQHQKNALSIYPLPLSSNGRFGITGRQSKGSRAAAKWTSIF